MKRIVGWRTSRRFEKCVPAFFLCALVAFLLFGAHSYGTSPTIYLIEKWTVDGTNGVLLHFDTDANRTYILQATDRLGTNAVWTNLYTAPKLPFTSHYIVPDLRPGNHFYRLSVTP